MRSGMAAIARPPSRDSCAAQENDRVTGWCTPTRSVRRDQSQDLSGHSHSLLQWVGHPDRKDPIVEHAASKVKLIPTLEEENADPAKADVFYRRVSRDNTRLPKYPLLFNGRRYGVFLAEQCTGIILLSGLASDPIS